MNINDDTMALHLAGGGWLACLACWHAGGMLVETPKKPTESLF
jgi:hypothetical protein